MQEELTMEEELKALHQEYLQVRELERKEEERFTNAVSALHERSQAIREKMQAVKRRRFKSAQDFAKQSVGQTWLAEQSMDYHCTPYTLYTLLTPDKLQITYLRLDDGEGYIITKIVKFPCEQAITDYIRTTDPISTVERDEVQCKMIEQLSQMV